MPSRLLRENCPQQSCLVVGPVCYAYNKPARCTHGCHSGTASIVLTSCFSIGVRPTSQEGANIWNCKLGEKLKAEELTGSSGKAAAIVLLIIGV